MSVAKSMPAACGFPGEVRFTAREARFTRPKNLKRNIALLAVIGAARRLWPVKTAHWLAGFGGISPRAAYLTLAETTEPSGATLANLIRSEAGFHFLDELMRPDFGPAPAWWADIQAGRRLVELERRGAENRAAIEHLRRQIGGETDA